MYGNYDDIAVANSEIESLRSEVQTLQRMLESASAEIERLTSQQNHDEIKALACEEVANQWPDTEHGRYVKSALLRNAERYRQYPEERDFSDW